MNNELNYIDLFSGAGGMSLGFDQAGFNNVFSIDIEPRFCETYKFNFPHHQSTRTGNHCKENERCGFCEPHHKSFSSFPGSFLCSEQK